MIVRAESAYLVLRQANLRDADTILKDLRHEDHLEWDASIEGGILHLRKSVKNSLRHGECGAVIRKSDKACQVLWGVTDTNKGYQLPVVWLIATNYAATSALAWMHSFWDSYQEFFQRWPKTECYSDDRNDIHHRWLEYLGYAHLRTLDYGPHSLPFRHYVRGVRQIWTMPPS